MTQEELDQVALKLFTEVRDSLIQRGSLDKPVFAIPEYIRTVYDRVLAFGAPP